MMRRIKLYIERAKKNVMRKRGIDPKANKGDQSKKGAKGTSTNTSNSSSKSK